MRQISKQSSTCFRRVVTFILAFAMIVTTLAVSSTESQAAAKVKKVAIGVKVGSSGILVLKKGQSKKLSASVSPKKASKKLTYKSSKKTVVSVSSKGVVKARKSKGSAKITVTSAQNKKKKATITVKIGKPVTKVAIQNKVQCNWDGANWTLVEKNGQMQKVYPKYKKTVQISKKTLSIPKGRMATLRTTLSPKNATQKKLLWKSSKSSVASILGSSTGTSCKITTRKEGRATLTAKATDGSGRTAKITVKVTPHEGDLTPAPTPTPDPRIVTMVEDFESYAPGTAWSRYTSRGKNAGTMTVVQDPENPDNKCLKLTFDGPDTAFDYAPVFSVDISKLKNSKGEPAAGKKLGSYSGVRLEARVIGNDPSAVQYKQVFCYFDKAGNIKAEDAFATKDNEGSTSHVSDKTLRFGVNIPMAMGDDTQNGCTLWNGNTSKETNKHFPFAYSTWIPTNASTHFANDSCTSGFKPEDTVEPKVGFARRTLTFNTDKIKEADESLLSDEKFDMVLGSTYEGGQTFSANGIKAALYIDNVAFVEDDIPLQGIEIGQVSELTPGSSASLSVTLTPANTTHGDLLYTSSDESVVKVDGTGKMTGIAEGTAVITVTPKDNPSLAKSVEVKVVRIGDQTESLDVLDLVKQGKDGAGIVRKAAEGEEEKDFPAVLSETDAQINGDGSLEIAYSDLNQSVFIDLGREYDLRGYKGVELTGKVPGQMELALFDGSLDKRKQTADGKEWYEAFAGSTYPFYYASCAWRFEDGGFNKKKSKAEGFVASNGSTPLSSEETQRFSWNTLTGTKGSGDYSKIRYICLKTNQPPVAQEGKRFENPDRYVISSLKITASQVNNSVLGYSKNAALEVNQANAESASLEYSDAGVKFGTADTVAAWYLDILDGTIKTAASHNKSFDLGEFQYLKVSVGADVPQLDVELAAEDGTAVPVGSDKGSGARTVYFALSGLGKDGKLSGLDTVRVRAHGGTVKLVTAITGLPLKETKDTDPKYVIEADGTKRDLTDEDTLD